MPRQEALLNSVPNITSAVSVDMKNATETTLTRGRKHDHPMLLSLHNSIKNCRALRRMRRECAHIFSKSHFQTGFFVDAHQPQLRPHPILLYFYFLPRPQPLATALGVRSCPAAAGSHFSFCLPPNPNSRDHC